MICVSSHVLSFTDKFEILKIAWLSRVSQLVYFIHFFPLMGPFKYYNSFNNIFRELFTNDNLQLNLTYETCTGIFKR